MTKWEYMEFRIKDEGDNTEDVVGKLNILGGIGWELIGPPQDIGWGSLYTMKRVKQTNVFARDHEVLRSNLELACHECNSEIGQQLRHTNPSGLVTITWNCNNCRSTRVMFQEWKGGRVLSSEPHEAHPLANSIIHFFSIETRAGLGPVPPVCEVGDKGEWVMFDHTATGVICPACQNAIDRKIV